MKRVKTTRTLCDILKDAWAHAKGDDSTQPFVLREIRISNLVITVNGMRNKIEDVLPSACEHILFDNVKFEATTCENNCGLNMLTGDRSVSFTRCEFCKCTMLQSDSLYFDNCKTENDLFIDAHSSCINLSKCKINGKLMIESAGTVGLYDSTFQTISVHNTTDDIEVNNCSSDRVTFTNCTPTSIVLESLDAKTITFERSYIMQLHIVANANPDKINYDVIELASVIISCKFKISNIPIKLLTADKAAVFGHFKYYADTISKFQITDSIGMLVPSGELILYKMCRVYKTGVAELESIEKMIVMLIVPASAQRVYCDEQKIRVSEAKVAKFLNFDGSDYKVPRGMAVHSDFDCDFIYKLGKVVKPSEAFDPTPGTCGSGIHGFIDINDAINYG